MARCAQWLLCVAITASMSQAMLPTAVTSCFFYGCCCREGNKQIDKPKLIDNQKQTNDERSPVYPNAEQYGYCPQFYSDRGRLERGDNMSHRIGGSNDEAWHDIVAAFHFRSASLVNKQAGTWRVNYFLTKAGDPSGARLFHLHTGRNNWAATVDKKSV